MLYKNLNYYFKQDTFWIHQLFNPVWHVVSELHYFDAVTAYIVSGSADTRGTREGEIRIDDL